MLIKLLRLRQHAVLISAAASMVVGGLTFAFYSTRESGPVTMLLSSVESQARRMAIVRTEALSTAIGGMQALEQRQAAELAHISAWQKNRTTEK